MKNIKKTLTELKKEHTYRECKTIESAQGTKITIDGKERLLISSNNYLGLALDKRIVKATQSALEKYGFGSGASRLISGTLTPHHELEKQIAKFKGTESAILYNSGYCANIGLLTAIAGRKDLILCDKHNHASIVDAALLSYATIRRYPHNDIEILEKFLQNATDFVRRIIVTDGVFSMDGDVALLKNIVALGKKYDAIVVVDDAHSTGVLGENGKGTLEHLGVKDDSVIQMGTLSKAVGCFGAFVAGKKELMEYLINKSRSFIYTTSMPPSNASAAIEAIKIITKEGRALREKLFENVNFLRDKLLDADFEVPNKDTHIIPVIIGDTTKTLDISHYLMENGIFAQAIRPPTVPRETSRLRITPTALHTKEELEYVFEVMLRWKRAKGNAS